MSNYNTARSATLHIKKTKTAVFKKLTKAIGGNFDLTKGKGDIYHFSVLLGDDYEGDQDAYNALTFKLTELISSRSVIVDTHLRGSTPNGIAAIRTYLPEKKKSAIKVVSIEYVGQ